MQINEITENCDVCIDYLKFLSYNYKKDFSNTLAIYQQIPTATAVADIEFWNITAKRYIKKGEIGISLFSDKLKKGTDSRFFDVSQTIGDDKNFDRLFWN